MTQCQPALGSGAVWTDAAMWPVDVDVDVDVDVEVDVAVDVDVDVDVDVGGAVMC